jgi:Cu/Ag efflux protein CusF
MMKVWLGYVAVVLYCAVCCAQAPPALKSVVGEVTAIDAAGKQIMLKGDDGMAHTVILGDATSYLRVAPGEKDLKKATKIAFTDVTVGDRALALEKDSNVPARAVVIMTKGDLAQKHEQERTDWQRRSTTGIISALSPESKEITITTRGRDSKTVTIDASNATFQRYSPDSVKFADAKPSSFGDLQPGDTVRVLGNKSEDGTHLKAEALVSGSFETIAGTVDSVDPATGEVHIINLQSKKPVAVRTNQNTLLRRLDPQIAAMLARRLRPDAAAAGAPGGAGAAGGSKPEGSAAPPGGPGEAGGQAGGQGRVRGFGGPGGGAGGAGGGDLQQILERMPQLSLSELKKGDAVIVSSAKVPGNAPVTAFSFVAGVEPFLAAAPRTGGQVNLGSWNLDVGGGPEE